MFMDVSNAGDYRTAIENIQAANKLFLKLDHKTRARFGNNPAEFLDFAADDGNADELREWGMLPALDAPPVEEEAPAEPDAPSED